MALTSIEICAGAGGQALGLEQAGFDHVAVVEIDHHACNTLRENRPSWNVIEGDVVPWIKEHAPGLTWSPEACPARPSPTRASSWAPTTNATSFPL